MRRLGSCKRHEPSSLTVDGRSGREQPSNRPAANRPFARSLGWPAPEFRGGGRFDDPANEFGVLYAAGDKRTCFLETLDVYRPDRAFLQRLLAMRAETFTPQSGLIPDSYFAKIIGRLRLDDGQRWLDVRASAPQTAVALSREPALAGSLPALGYDKRFKPGDLVGSDRRLTQLIARWAYDNAYAGVAYSCSHDLRLTCWAVFEGAAFSAVPPPLRIERDDPDLIAIAKEFELTVSFTIDQ